MDIFKIGFLTQIPRLFRELNDLLKEPMQIKEEKRIRFFENEIMPIHDIMKEINKDYIAGFMLILELVDSKRQNIDNINTGIYNKYIYNEIKKQRLKNLVKRSEVVAFSEEIKIIKKRKYLTKDDISFFIDYAEAIETFFNYYCDPLTNHIRIKIEQKLGNKHKSHYRHLIQILDHIELLNNMNEKNGGYRDDIEYFGIENDINYFNYIDDIIINYCNNTLHDTIPTAFKNYLNKYIRLKINYIK